MNDHDKNSKYRMRKLIAGRLAKGLCICGKEKTQGFYRCVGCMEQQKIDRERLKEHGPVIISTKKIENKRLYDCMTGLKLGTKEISQMVGVHQRTVWAWIAKGTVPVNKDRRQKVNEILNMDIF